MPVRPNCGAHMYLEIRHDVFGKRYDAVRDRLGWIVEPPASLQHADPVPLFRQPQCRDTAAEA